MKNNVPLAYLEMQMSKYVDQIEKIVEETAQQSSPASSQRVTPEHLSIEMGNSDNIVPQSKPNRR